MTPQPTPTPSSSPSRPLVILVADDEPMIVQALARVLKRRGHTVHSAGDADTALELLGRHAFDAVLVDARMPGSGLTVLDHVNRDESFSGIAVLMTGGLATDPTDQVGPSVRRLQKPFRFPDVIPLVEGARH